jgi:hypothetical protein
MLYTNTGDEDKTSPNEDEDAITDDLDESFGDDEDSEGADFDEEETKSEEKSDDKKKETESDDKSAIYQKKRYREQLRQARERIKELESEPKGKGGDLSEDQKRERAAEEFLVTKIRDVLGALEAEKSREQNQRTEAFQGELDDVLDENPNITEKQILELTEELSLSPKQALKVIERERKMVKREKPNVPKERRASTEVRKSESKDSSSEPRTLDSISKRIKDALKKGTY